MSAHELTRFSELVGLIYDGSTAPDLWSDHILPVLADYIQAPECFLYTIFHAPESGGYMFYHGIPQSQIDLYFKKYQQEDVWVGAAVEKGLVFDGSVGTGDQLVPRERWLQSKAYNECFKRDPNMMQYMGGVIFGLDNKTSMPAALSFFRGGHHPDFGDVDLDRLKLILPHVSRSLGVMQRLRSSELTVATTLSALNKLPNGVILLDSVGLVAFTNRAAQRMLSDEDGLILRKKISHSSSLGILCAENVEASSAISGAISSTLNRDPFTTPHFSKCITVPRTSGIASYALQFSALGSQNEFGEFAAIIFIADGAREIIIDPLILQSAYGLTPAEAKVAITLVESDSVQNVADTLGTSTNTVRSQIKQIYIKLGVDSRARFVKLLLALVAE